MIDKISYEIVKAIAENLTFADKWAGLVRPLRKKVQKTETVFPVAINTPTNCEQSDYQALVPDSSKRSVMYIEKNGNAEFENVNSHFEQVSHKLRLVVWYNLDKITEGAYISEDVLVDQVLDLLPKKLSDALFTGVKQVHILPTTVTYGTEIVSQYTYNEIKSQFGTHPYGMFAIDLDVWYITTHCSRGITVGDGCVTGKGNHVTVNNNPE